jgi:nicotinamidase-related amidase
MGDLADSRLERKKYYKKRLSSVSLRDQRKQPNHGKERREVMKPALLVIDMQNQFFNLNQACSDSLKSAIEYINAAIILFRKKNLPIVAIQHKSEEEGLVPGKPCFDIPSSVKIESQDMYIVKTYSNSFTKTELAEKLRNLGVDTVIVTGFCAEYCVLSTYKGAQDYDFTPIILRGSLASDNAEHIRFVEEITETISLGAMKTLLQPLSEY